MNKDFHIFSRIIIDSFDLNFPLFSGLDNGFNEASCGFSIGKILDYQGFVVDLFNLSPDPDRTAPEPVIVPADFSKSACREIRIDFKVFALKVLDRGINDFIEVVRQDF